MKKAVTAFAPATVANISCGFDVLGLALNKLGDRITIEISNQRKIQILEISGDDNLPKDPTKNVCGVIALQMLEESGVDEGVNIRIQKGIRGGSGLGSSAASSVATAVAMNSMLDNPFDKSSLLQFAVEGEFLASGSRHADNVSPALMGGITLVRSHEPLDVISLPTPDELYIVILFPNIKINTQDARRILKTKVDFTKASKQWANLAAFIAGIYRNDYDLIGRSMNDLIVEPVRSLLIPGFQILKETAITEGALGFGISGSGPSVFALVKGDESAKIVQIGMEKAYSSQGIEFEMFVSSVNAKGAAVVDETII